MGGFPFGGGDSLFSQLFGGGDLFGGGQYNVCCITVYFQGIKISRIPNGESLFMDLLFLRLRTPYTIVILSTEEAF